MCARTQLSRLTSDSSPRSPSQKGRRKSHSGRMNAASSTALHALRLGNTTHVLPRLRVRFCHVKPAPRSTPPRISRPTFGHAACIAHPTANMSDQAPSLKRVHTEEGSISPPAVKRRQQSTTTSASEIRTAEVKGDRLTRATQARPWRTSSSHLPRSRSLRKGFRGPSSRTASSSESTKPPTQSQPLGQTSLAGLLFLTLYVRTPTRFSRHPPRSMGCL